MKPQFVTSAFQTLTAIELLLEFLEKNAANSNDVFRYITYVIGECVPLCTAMTELANVEANWAGCAFLGSLFPWFEDNYLMSRPEEDCTTEKIIRCFKDNILSLTYNLWVWRFGA